eukprot:COSAG05_NODE_15532_length_367_cov_0.776119_1_plen_25_part_10
MKDLKDHDGDLQWDGLPSMLRTEMS